MNSCPKCSSDVADEAVFCPDCGTRIEDIGGKNTLPFPSPDPYPSEGAVHLKAGERFADRYEILEKIGEGGMGVVYKATDSVSNELVALKLIRADRMSGERAMKRLIEEGLVTRKLRHPNIIAVYDVGEDGGQPFVSMEYVEGESLRNWHSRMKDERKDVSFRVASRIVTEILDGIKIAHDAGVIHRDLSPENIMLTAEPSETRAPLKILDFGIARVAKISSDTSTTSALGKPRYMAPEQITTPDIVRPSADFYSLSVMFYELLVDVLPQGHWQPPSGGRADISQGIDAVIERGLSNRPSNRPQSAVEYRQWIVSAVNDPRWRPPASATNSGPVDPPVTPQRKEIPKWVWWVIGGLGLIIWLEEYALAQPANASSFETYRIEAVRQTNIPNAQSGRP